MGEAASKEPSMEDILASIRRIVTQDEAPDEAPAHRPSAAQPPRAAVTYPASAKPSSASHATQPSSPNRSSTPPRPATSSRRSPPSFADQPAAETGGFARFAREVADEMRAPPSTSHRREPAPSMAPRAAPAASTAAPPTAPRPGVTMNRRTEDWQPAEQHAAAMPPPRPQAPRAAMPEERLAASHAPGLQTASASRPSASAAVPSASRPAAPKPAAAKAEIAPSAETVPEHAIAAGKPATASEKEVEAFRGALTSPGSEAAVRSSLDRLKRGVNNDLDAKVEAVLRPMLRDWLDENLPKMVERLVRDEIERLAGRN